MLAFIKKWWDIIGGIVVAFALSFIVDFELVMVQLLYSLVILTIACIGFLRFIKQEADKERKTERNHNIIDDVVDRQKPLRAIHLAQSPSEEGEKIGEKFLLLWKGLKPVMQKFKIFFEKFKGYIAAILVAALGIVEMFGGYINYASGGLFTVYGIPLIPALTLALATGIALFSDKYTAEEKSKIKALFMRGNTTELVLAHIKKTIKEKSALLTKLNKTQTTLERELSTLEGEKEQLSNTLQAKREMFTMTPQLATQDEVLQAEKAVSECIDKITAKNEEIAKTKTEIEDVSNMIADLKEKIQGE